MVIVWWDGDKSEYMYFTEEDAREAERGYRKAFGGQIQYIGVYPQTL